MADFFFFSYERFCNLNVFHTGVKKKCSDMHASLCLLLINHLKQQLFHYNLKLLSTLSVYKVGLIKINLEIPFPH